MTWPFFSLGGGQGNGKNAPLRAIERPERRRSPQSGAYRTRGRLKKTGVSFNFSLSPTTTTTTNWQHHACAARQYRFLSGSIKKKRRSACWHDHALPSRPRVNQQNAGRTFLKKVVDAGLVGGHARNGGGSTSAPGVSCSIAPRDTAPGRRRSAGTRRI